MSQPPLDDLQTRLRQVADTFSYPPSPDIASAVRWRLEHAPTRPAQFRRYLAWGVVIALVILAGLMAVPQVRAAVFEILRIGAVRIVPVAPTPLVTPAVPTSAPASVAPIPTPLNKTQATPSPSPTPLSSVLDLAGETTLAEARAKVSFPIRLPAYPADLGAPDHVFLQDLGGPMVVLVWMDGTQPGRVRMSLHELGPGTFAEKVQPPVIEATTINGQPAVWTEGPYLLQFLRGGQVVYETQRLVEGHTLVWTQGQVTYRLESDLTLTEAARIAAALK
jgi:hypothetical protein